MADEVAVAGAGVAGLTAAHELAERGFDVTVFESKDVIGGKSRSIDVPETADGHEAYPGEHGFRFFPGFYRHVIDTMDRIPDGDGNVTDNLVATTEFLKSIEGEPDRVTKAEYPDSVSEIRDLLEGTLWRDVVPDTEHNVFTDRVIAYMTSCDARRENEYDEVTWWDFIEAEGMSEAYKKYLGRGTTKLLVAMKPEQSSARTIGGVTVQTFFDIIYPDRDPVRILNAPTNEAWIDPWVEHLEELGVTFEPASPVTGVDFDGERLTALGVGTGEDHRTVEADHYVLALPLDVLRELVTDEMRAVAPQFAGIDELETDWMNGVQFYLDEDVPVAHGHGIYFDSPWALTTISQRQFWDVDFDRYGEIEGILSVCVSDWNTPGVLYDKPARECSPDEVRDEVLEQLRRHLDDASFLDDDHVVDWFLDPAIEHDDGESVNHEQLFINTVGSLADRPVADTAIPNCYVAADFVRTNADLATMESANEAARRAVNGVLDAVDSDADRCGVWSFDEPAVLEPLKAVDRVRYRMGLPHLGEYSKRFWKTLVRISP